MYFRGCRHPAAVCDHCSIKQKVNNSCQPHRCYLLACRWQSCWSPLVWLWTARVLMKWWWWRGKLWVNHNSSWDCLHSSPTATAPPGPSEGERETTPRWDCNDVCSGDRRRRTQNNQKELCILFVFSSAGGRLSTSNKQVTDCSLQLEGECGHRGWGRTDVCKPKHRGGRRQHSLSISLD